MNLAYYQAYLFQIHNRQVNMRQKIRGRYDSTKRLRNLIPVLIFGILLMGSEACFALGAETIPVTDSCLDLHITLDDFYKIKESISIIVTLENICNKSITVKKRFAIGPDIILSVIDPKGNPLRLLPPVPPPPLSPNDLLTLAPEQSVRVTIENIQYLLSETLAEGTYEVFITYFGGIKIERGRNKVLSNRVTFDVFKNNSGVRK